MPKIKRTTNQKAQEAGGKAARLGCSLPTNEKLQSKYGEEGMRIYKESFIKHCGTDEEQHMRKVQAAAIQCGRNGTTIPSDEKLEKKYGLAYIKIYKETYSKNYKTRYTPQGTLTQNAFIKQVKRAGRLEAQQGYLLSSDDFLKSMYGEEGMRAYKEFFIKYSGTDTEQYMEKVQKVQATAIESSRQDITLPSDAGLEKNYGLEYVKTYKKAHVEHNKLNDMNRHDKISFTKNLLNLKASDAGKNAALTGCSLPNDDKLKSRYGEEGMRVYKEFFTKYCGTEEEQCIRRVKDRVKSAAIRHERKGFTLPDTELEKKYGLEYVKVYKETYLKHSKFHDHVSQVVAVNNINTSNTTNKRVLKDGEFPPNKKSAQEAIQAPIADFMQLESQCGLMSNDDIHQLNAIYSAPLSFQEYISFPDANELNQNNNADSLFLNTQAEIAFDSNSTLEEYDLDSFYAMLATESEDNVSSSMAEDQLINDSNSLLFDFNSKIDNLKVDLTSSSKKEDMTKNQEDINKSNVIHSASLNKQDPIPSPFDVLKKMS